MSEISQMISNKQIMQKLKDFNTKIIIYKDLQNYNNLLDLLDNDKEAVLILIETKVNVGHWTVLIRNNNDIYYSDSYGVKPDGEMKNIDYNNRYMLGETNNNLSKLINELPNNYSFTYNKMDYQSHENNVNTCGRWCTVIADYILKNNASLFDFHNYFENQKSQQNGISNDQLICELYDKI